MQIALAQLAGREGDIAYNLSRTLACLRDADAETSLIVFPETHLTGFAEPGHVEDRALALGREAAVLVRGPHAAGAHVARLDTSALAPGLYVVHLKAEGQEAAVQLTVVR